VDHSLPKPETQAWVWKFWAKFKNQKKILLTFNLTQILIPERFLFALFDHVFKPSSSAFAELQIPQLLDLPPPSNPAGCQNLPSAAKP
jgi:hypothetical protein